MSSGPRTDPSGSPPRRPEPRPRAPPPCSPPDLPAPYERRPVMPSTKSSARKYGGFTAEDRVATGSTREERTAAARRGGPGRRRRRPRSGTSSRRSPGCPGRTVSSPSRSTRSSGPPRPASRPSSGTECPRTHRTARWSAASRARRSSGRGTPRSVSPTGRRWTTAPCGRPPTPCGADRGRRAEDQGPGREGGGPTPGGAGQGPVLLPPTSSWRGSVGPVPVGRRPTGHVRVVGPPTASMPPRPRCRRARSSTAYEEPGTRRPSSASSQSHQGASPRSLRKRR